MGDPTRCQATNQQGQPCSAAHYRDGWCRWHHPDLDHERRAWSAKGGRNGSHGARARKKLAGDLRDMAGVKVTLLEAMRQVKDGTMEPGPANALANLARAVVVVAGVADFEGQLSEMRREIADLAERKGA